MTFFACGNNVQPRQWKPCKAMVKFTDSPGTVVMTRFTGFARLPFVFVVFLMAAKALQRSLTIALRVFVASSALELRLDMGVAQ